MPAAVIVIGSTAARVNTNHRETGSTVPDGRFDVRRTWRQLARSEDDPLDVRVAMRGL